DVARSPAPAGRGRARAGAARARGQPLRPAALRGRAAADDLLVGRPDRWARRRLGPGHLPPHVLGDPLPGAPPGGGGRTPAGAREAQPRQAGGGPVLLAGHAAVRRRILQGARPPGYAGLAGVPRAPEAALSLPARRDAGRAPRALWRSGALD